MMIDSAMPSWPMIDDCTTAVRSEDATLLVVCCTRSGTTATPMEIPSSNVGFSRISMVSDPCRSGSRAKARCSLKTQWVPRRDVVLYATFSAATGARSGGEEEGWQLHST